MCQRTRRRFPGDRAYKASTEAVLIPSAVVAVVETVVVDERLLMGRT
jgi:hypothetical protein